MEESILNTIKKMLGLQPDYTVYDTDILVHINTVLSTLWQLGLEMTDAPLRISDTPTTWQDLLGDNDALDMVKDYIYLRVKLMFDYPSSSACAASMIETIKELEFRIYTEVNNSN